MYEEREVSALELRDLFNSNEYNIEIDTPDGWQPVVKWFDKGSKVIHHIKTQNRETKVSFNHLFQDENNVWNEASTYDVGTFILTEDGPEEVISNEIIGEEEVYDFTVDHENHRYYSDGFVSHNSGKSYLVSGNAIKDAQKQGIFVILIDTENALDEQWLHNLGVDTSEDKLIKFNVAMIDEVAKIISEFVDQYKKDYADLSDEDRPKVLFVIDSLGMLMTPTDVAHFQNGDLKGDMGRKPKALKALITNCVNMFGNLNIGMICTNHSYASQDMFNPDPVVSGGCLIADTKVLLADGTYKNIQDFSIGDKVVTMYGEDEVSNLWKYEKETYTFELEDGNIIECSPEHKFLVERDEGQIWVRAEDLTVLDSILSI